ncbi:class III lanthionine synthetase LanKC [Glycomyces salinus]|uniref:class III lanthionine synthetase LanKC n=1 Tax=Glycomyces salinus TaxID=980294 RepID=UPI0018EC9AEA|nr:class III lanthionine synthetase LanKC [Glycomyces salinus]
MESGIALQWLFGDRVWYTPAEEMADRDDAHPIVRRALPTGWERANNDVWCELRLIDQKLPEQGWKIHLSAVTDEYEATVERAWDVCEREGASLKFLSHPRLHLLSNAKGANRVSAGKLVTAYPTDEEHCRTLVQALHGLLGDRPSPFILSDLRWGESPVFLRYGAFKPMWIESATGRRPAIRHPDGHLVPDRREPAFTLPDWAELSDWIASGTGFRPAEQQEDPSEPTVGDYVVKEAMHFSNAGGVYLALAPDGSEVVLKEARPLCGVDAEGRDAVDRLHHEHAVLRDLEDLGWTPAPLGIFTEWEHHFLAMEYCHGKPLSEMAAESPLIRPGTGAGDREEFRRGLVPLFEALERALEEIHGTGWAVGDLNPRNLLFDEETGELRIIDLEAARRTGSEAPPGIGTAGFNPGRAMSPETLDHYASACCEISALAPFNQAFHLNDEAVPFALERLSAWYDLDTGHLNRLASRLTGGRTHGSARGLDVDRMHRSMRTDSGQGRPKGSDRTDPRGFGPGSAVGLAYGAAGIVFADASATGGFDPDDLAGIHERALASRPEAALGLYDGLAGAAWILGRAGHPGAADVADLVLQRAGRQQIGMSLYSGAIGVCRMLEDLGRSEKVGPIAEGLLGHLTSAEPDALPPGLLHGWSGAAMFFADQYRRTGTETWHRGYDIAVDRAAAHLHRDGRQELMMDGRKALPYLERGSCGLALALMSGREWIDRRRREALERILTATTIDHTVEAGLFRGRLGLWYTSLQAHRLGLADDPGIDLDQLAPFACPTGTEDRLALLGRESHRLSHDLATGSAGVVYLAALAEQQTCQLPGMGLAGAERDSSRSGYERSIEKRKGADDG